jgi:hypothetical protein
MDPIPSHILLAEGWQVDSQHRRAALFPLDHKRLKLPELLKELTDRYEGLGPSRGKHCQLVTRDGEEGEG